MEFATKSALQVLGGSSVWVRSGVTVGTSPEPLRSGCPPGLRSADLSRDERSVRRLALAAIESCEGGMEELVESRPQPGPPALRSTPEPRSSCEAKPTTSAASSSYEGDRCSGPDTTQMIDDQRPEIETDTPSPTTNSYQDRLTATAQLNQTRERTPGGGEGGPMGGLSGGDVRQVFVEGTEGLAV